MTVAKTKHKGRARNEVHLAAVASGAKYFTTGEPCRYGHNSPRYTSSWACVECAILRRSGDASFIEQAKRAIDRAKDRVFHGKLGAEVARLKQRAATDDPDIISEWRKDHELVTWGGPYPTLMSGKWR